MPTPAAGQMVHTGTGRGVGRVKFIIYMYKMSTVVAPGTV